MITKVVVTRSKTIRKETGKQVESPSSRYPGFLEVFVLYHLSVNGSFLSTKKTLNLSDILWTFSNMDAVAVIVSEAGCHHAGLFDVFMNQIV